MSLCDECAYFEYDEDDEQYVCSADMDEDDLKHLIIHLVNKDSRIKKHILKY